MSLNKKETSFLNQQRQLLYLKNASAGIGGGSASMQGVLRPSTGLAKPNKPQAMYTNLNGVLRNNPELFYPKQVAKINFHSTEYNFINF